MVDLFENDPDGVVAAVRDHRAALCNPPRSTSDYLTALERLWPEQNGILGANSRNRDLITVKSSHRVALEIQRSWRSGRSTAGTRMQGQR